MHDYAAVSKCAVIDVLWIVCTCCNRPAFGPRMSRKTHKMSKRKQIISSRGSERNASTVCKSTKMYINSRV